MRSLDENVDLAVFTAGKSLYPNGFQVAAHRLSDVEPNPLRKHLEHRKTTIVRAQRVAPGGSIAVCDHAIHL